MKFSELGLIAPILKALEQQGYDQPTPIQEGAIPPAAAGRDVLGCAQTGTGKTCAFATPILQRLFSSPSPGPRHIRALILTPTRELALQIQECFVAYGTHLPLRSAVIFGGVGQNPQVEKIRRGLDILVATPGRLLDLQGQGLLDLSRVEIFVLDEADRMLDMGFIHDVRRVLKLLPVQKQTLFFSATMPPEVTELVNTLLHNPAKVAVDPVSSPVEVIEQSLYLVDKGNKSKLLAFLMEDLRVKNALIFTRTKHGANKVAADLIKAGISAAAIHGNKSQTARQQALGDFKAGTIRALVATDIAARGLDIEELSHVFNYNLPEVPETYVHRIGRTGRAGRGGVAVSFCDFGEKQYLRDIERLIGKSIPHGPENPWPMEIFEEVKDAKGRAVNADDAEARAAARERKKLRDAAKRQEKAQPAAKDEPARRGEKPAAPRKAEPAPAVDKKKRQPRWKKSEEGTARLDGVLPERSDDGHHQTPTDFRRPNPLASDRIMDATARLLAPRSKPVVSPAPKPAAPAKQAPRPVSAATPVGEENRNSRRRKTQGKPPEATAPKAPPAPAPAPKKDGRRHDRGHRGPRPPELRRSSVKDSTEQPSLMKPYYIEHD